MPIIPAICDTCGTVWFAKSPIAIAPEAKATISRCGIAPCPSCGRTGTIPEGVYESTRITFTNPQQFAVVVSALIAIKEMIDAKAEPSEIAKTIDEKYPFLAYLKKFIPKNLKDLSILVAILLAVTHSCRDDTNQGGPPADIRVQEKIVEALRDIVSRIPKNPPSSQPASPN